MFFLDADVVLNMILGIPEVYLEADNAGTRARCVWALLSEGALGQLHMLRPHQLELYNQIRNLPDPGSTLYREQYERVSRHVAPITNVPEPSAADRRDGQSSLAQWLQLARLGRDQLVRDSLRGPWFVRLNRIMGNGILRFDAPEVELSAVADDRRVDDFRQALDVLRPSSALANYRDALALVSLMHLAARRDGGGMLPLLRFYSETPTLTRLWQVNSTPRLTATPNSHYRPVTAAEAGGCWDVSDYVRDADYMIARAILGDGATREHTGTNAVSHMPALLEAIEGLRVQLRNESSLQLAVDDPELVDLIEAFESLSFVDELLRRRATGRGGSDPLSGDPWPSDPAWATRMRDALRHIRRRLSADVARLSRWMEVERLVEQSVERIQRVSGCRVPDPIRDVGLVRWGLPGRSADVSRARDTLACLLTAPPDDPEARRTRRRVASLSAGDCRSAGDVFVLVVVLWHLDMYDALSRAMDLIPVALAERLEPSIRLVRLAADVRGEWRLQRSTVHFKRQLDSLWGLLEADGGSGRGWLGLGFLCYHAWKRQGREWQAASHTPTGEEQRILDGWLRMSIACGEKALSGARGGSVEQAFALNHLAYLGIVGDSEASTCMAALAHLDGLRGNRNVWHYRLADTIAWGHVMVAERQLQSSPTVGIDTESHLLARQSLRAAWMALTETGLHHADPEFVEHVGHIQSLAGRLGVVLGGDDRPHPDSSANKKVEPP